MEWLWTWGGSSFGYRETGELLDIPRSVIVGRFHGHEVYGADGLDLGEVMNGDRLIVTPTQEKAARAELRPIAGGPQRPPVSASTALPSQTALWTSRDRTDCDDRTVLSDCCRLRSPIFHGRRADAGRSSLARGGRNCAKKQRRVVRGPAG